MATKKENSKRGRPSTPPTSHTEVEGELCKRFYNKFGQEALPIIEDVFREWGTVLGEKRKAKMPKVDLRAAIEAYFGPALNREPKPKIIEPCEGRIELHNFVCPYCLNGAGRELCQAMMAMDRAMLETLLGDEIDYEVPKTVADGDEYCLGVITRK